MILMISETANQLWLLPQKQQWDSKREIETIKDFILQNQRSQSLPNANIDKTVM